MKTKVKFEDLRFETYCDDEYINVDKYLGGDADDMDDAEYSDKLDKILCLPVRELEALYDVKCISYSIYIGDEHVGCITTIIGILDNLLWGDDHIETLDAIHNQVASTLYSILEPDNDDINIITGNPHKGLYAYFSDITIEHKWRNRGILKSVIKNIDRVMGDIGFEGTGIDFIVLEPRMDRDTDVDSKEFNSHAELIEIYTKLGFIKVDKDSRYMLLDCCNRV